MSYRITKFRIEGGRLLEDFGNKHLIHMEETEKAVLVFEADMFVCRLFIDLVDARFKERAIQIRADLKEGNPIRDEDREILDKVFEDILTFVEFYENLLTSQGDRAMATLMTHVRFSAAMLLRIDRSRSEFHKHSRSNKKMNSAVFRHDSKDEIGQIYHLNYNRGLKKMIIGTVLDYKAIMSELDVGQRENILSYYYGILSDMQGDTRYFNVRLSEEDMVVWGPMIGGDVMYFKGAPHVPLFKLVDTLVKELPDLYKRYIFLDYKCMTHNNINVCAPAIGKVGARDNNLNTAQNLPSDLANSYDKAVLEQEIMSIRALDTIYRCSSVENKSLIFSFPMVGTMRFLDPWLFGWKYDLLPVVFCMDSKELYDRFMRKYDKITTDSAVIVDWVKISQSDWQSGKRMWTGNRVPGGIFKFSTIDYVRPDGLAEYMQFVKEPTVIVISPERMDEIISFLNSYTTTSERGRVNSIFIISSVENFVFSGTIIPYTSALVIKEERLMDALTLHNIRLIELLVESYLNAMASDLGISLDELSKIKLTDFKAACYRKFSDEVDKAKNVLADYRRLLDNLD